MRIEKSYARIAVGCAIAFVAYVGYGIYTAGLDERPPPPSSSSLIFRYGTMTGHRITTRSWSADFDRIVSNADQSVLDLDGVHHGIVFRNGKAYLHVRATHMTVNTVSHDFTATGPFHVESVGAKPPRSFDTTSAIWNDAAQTMALTRHIVIHNGADAPLSVGALTLSVKTGEIEVHDIDGPLRTQ